MSAARDSAAKRVGRSRTEVGGRRGGNGRRGGEGHRGGEGCGRRRGE